ncbi:24930_t:CDS:2 [Dentiscutata erythropus]|uniref:24930_t:CDS:1 n=1 Tax=Dentiscutata erythropus TaxID=1348616 RepID=A0A9N9FI59_9GLOM|nr:24930_t:CDS:2 [Dentiscutata erythropus]
MLKMIFHHKITESTIIEVFKNWKCPKDMEKCFDLDIAQKIYRTNPRKPIETRRLFYARL